MSPCWAQCLQRFCVAASLSADPLCACCICVVFKKGIKTDSQTTPSVILFFIFLLKGFFHYPNPFFHSLPLSPKTKPQSRNSQSSTAKGKDPRTWAITCFFPQGMH